jgi:radical SAM superfamily enzyme YgiQ (UPF0313 family)
MHTPVDFLIFNGRSYVSDTVKESSTETSGSVQVSQRTMGAYKVAYHCRLQGFKVQVVEFIEQLTYQEYIDIIDKFVGPNTLAVGTSTTFLHLPLSKNKTVNIMGEYSFLSAKWIPTETQEEEDKITQHIKNINPDCKIIVGGAMVNKKSLEYSNIDIISSGYGEVNVPDILLSLQKKEEIKKHFEDIWSMHEIQTSSMTWTNEDLLEPGEIIPFEIARGCIFKCNFCNFRMIGKEKGTYVRASELIRDEFVRNYEKFGISRYWITDDTFNDDNDRLEELRDIVQSLPFKIELVAFIRFDLVIIKDQAQLLKDCGFKMGHAGFETTNPESAKDIGKGMPPLKQMDYLRELKKDIWKDIYMHSGFMMGLPSDTKKSIRDMLNFLRSDNNPLDSYFVFPLNISLPDPHASAPPSDFAKNPQEYGYEWIPFEKKELEEYMKDGNFANYKNKHGITYEDMWNYRAKFLINNLGHPNEYKRKLMSQFQCFGLTGSDLTPEELLQQVKEGTFTTADCERLDRQNKEKYFNRLMSIKEHTTFETLELVDADNLKRISIAREQV